MTTDRNFDPPYVSIPASSVTPRRNDQDGSLVFVLRDRNDVCVGHVRIDSPNGAQVILKPMTFFRSSDRALLCGPDSASAPDAAVGSPV